MVLKKIFDKKVAVGPKPGLKPEQWPVEVENGDGELVKVGESEKESKVSDAKDYAKIWRRRIGEMKRSITNMKKNPDHYVDAEKQIASMEKEIKRLEGKIAEKSKVSDSQGYGTVIVANEEWKYPLDASIHVDFKLISPDGYEEWCSDVEDAHPDDDIRGQIQRQRRYGYIGDAYDKDGNYVDTWIEEMEDEDTGEAVQVERYRGDKYSQWSRDYVERSEMLSDPDFREYLEKHVSSEAIEPLLKTGKYDGEVMFTDEDTDETIPIEVHYNLKKFWNDYQKWKKRWDELADPMDNFYKEIKEIDSRAAERERRDRISELSRQLQRLYRDMENDPEVLAEQGNGGEATDRYGVEIDEIEEEIERLKS